MTDENTEKLKTAEETAFARASFEQNVMMRPEIMAQIEKMAPTDRKEYIDQMFRDYTGETTILTEQLNSANELRNKEGPQGRTIGNNFFAANPLEHIASLAESYQGNKERDSARKGLGDLSSSRTAGLGKTADMFANQFATQNPTGVDIVTKANSNASISPEEARANKLIEIANGLRAVPT
tara:strand:+ start:1944 stop:2486 length:543 start_codon:yes stop_codon:yes gene_type:complete